MEDASNSMTNKAKVLKQLKGAVLSLIREGTEMDPKGFASNYQILNEDIKSLNSCDACWVNDQYGAWFKADPEVQQAIKSR